MTKKNALIGATIFLEIWTCVGLVYANDSGDEFSQTSSIFQETMSRARALKFSNGGNKSIFTAAGENISASYNPFCDSDENYSCFDSDDNDPPKENPSALMIAAGDKQLNMVKTLIAQGVAINNKDNLGKTALMCAANQISFDDNSNSSLSAAAKIIRMLIAAGADINAKDNVGRTALMYAAGGATQTDDNCVGGGYSDVIQTLIADGATINARDQQGKTALIYAAVGYIGDFPDHATSYINPREDYPDGCRPNVIRTLVKAHADVNAKDKNGWTALKYAQYNEAIEIMKVLIASGAHWKWLLPPDSPLRNPSDQDEE